MIIEVHVTQNGFFSESLCSDYRIEKKDSKGTINLMFANIAVTAREAKTIHYSYVILLEEIVKLKSGK